MTRATTSPDGSKVISAILPVSSDIDGFWHLFVLRQIAGDTPAMGCCGQFDVAAINVASIVEQAGWFDPRPPFQARD